MVLASRPGYGSGDRPGPGSASQPSGGDGSDLALLKTLGFTRRQLAVTLTWQASVTAVVGIVVGVPLGIAAGRQLWILFARNIDVVPQPSVPLSVLFVALAASLLANLVAAVPGRRGRDAGRHHPPTGLSEHPPGGRAVIWVGARRSTPRRGHNRSRGGGRERSHRVLRHPARRHGARVRRQGRRPDRRDPPHGAQRGAGARTATTHSSTHWRTTPRSWVIAFSSTAR